jgi:hydrogenase maturation protease
VLVGEEGERGTMLASPIILEDHPRIAPESPGDLFDGGEIDQMLVLNILSLTDEEKAEMRASDPRAREILERTEALSEEELMRLHGAVRELGMARER